MGQSKYRTVKRGREEKQRTMGKKKHILVPARGLGGLECLVCKPVFDPFPFQKGAMALRPSQPVRQGCLKAAHKAKRVSRKLSSWSLVFP